MIIPEQCRHCKHFRPKSIHCTAFPDGQGIPLAILDMEADHRDPFPGDNGIQWEPREPGIEHPFAEDEGNG